MREGTDRLAVRYGLLIGAGGGVLGLGIAALSMLAKAAPDCGVSLMGCVAFLALLWLLFESGHITALRTGTIGSGVLAGGHRGRADGHRLRPVCAFHHA